MNIRYLLLVLFTLYPAGQWQLQAMQRVAVECEQSIRPHTSLYIHPFKKNGRYYFSEKDSMYNFDIQATLKSAIATVISPTQWKKGLDALLSAGTETKKVDLIHCIAPMQTIPEQEPREPKIIWLGHSTFLIQINGFNILTDPILGDGQFCPCFTTKRTMPVGVKLENLPPIDLIIISHNHPDHMDKESLISLSKKHNPLILAPEGNKEYLEKIGCSRVIENTWWIDNNLTKNSSSITCTFLPAYHWSLGSQLTSYCRSLWGSWMIQFHDTCIYFAGDTGYENHFKEIAQNFPSIDIALMPIGPTNDDEGSHSADHIDARQAIDSFIDLGAKCFIPMHYGTFSIKKKHLENPINALHTYWEQKQDMLKDKKLLFAQCGQQYNVKVN